MSKAIIPIGTRFSRLTVVERAAPYQQPDGYFRPMSRCVCDCGAEVIVRDTCLRIGHTRSCGCLIAENSVTHGHGKKGTFRSRTYHSWQHMKDRCHNPLCKSYPEYGARGIIVCERWLESFENFLADMGECPAGLSIDRIRNLEGYYPGNCRWATQQQQMRNTRANHIVTVRGRTGSLAELVEFFGTDYDTAKRRINSLGWDAERAFFTPVRKCKKRVTGISEPLF